MKTPQKTYKAESKWDTRRKPTPNWEPMPRHYEILEYVWEHGFLAPHHIALLFSLSKRRSEELLKELWDNGYLNRPNPKLRARYSFMPYVLSKGAAKKIAKRQKVTLKDLDWMKEPLWDQLEHDAGVTEFRLILDVAIQREPDFTFLEWVNETVFRSRKDEVEYTTVKGHKATKQIFIDGYARVRRDFPTMPDRKPDYLRLLVEAEVSHKSNPRFADHKVLPQYAYIRSQIYQKRFGSTSGRFIYLVPTEEKMDNYINVVRNVLPKKDWVLFYFTTYEPVTIDTILYEPFFKRASSDEPVALFKS